MELGEDVIRSGRRYDEMDDTLRVRPTLAEQACRNLWAAVLAQAVEDYLAEPGNFARFISNVSRSRRYNYAQSMRNQHERRQDRVTAWLFEEETVGDAGSFPWICDVLGLDRSYVRQRAKMRRVPMRTFMTVH